MTNPTELPKWRTTGIFIKCYDTVHPQQKKDIVTVLAHYEPTHKTHKPFCETIGRTLYFNPGYAGKPRFKLARSVAILHCDTNGIRPEFLEL